MQHSKGQQGGRRVQAGMVTAEYAVGVVAGCTFAGICVYPIVTSTWMQRLLEQLLFSTLTGWW